MENTIRAGGKWIAVIMLSVLWICAGCTPTSGPEIHVTGAWVRAVNVQQGTTGNNSSSQATAMPGMPGMTEATSMPDMPGMSDATSAVYLTIQNTGSQADRLVSATSQVAQSIEIHQSQVQDNVASMQKLDTLALPAQSTIQFQPGGYHLMLIGVNRALNPGDKISVDLQFEKSAPILVEVEVRGP
jgi:periplasmic copper chaperone A